MNIPKLKKIESVKNYHGIELKDEYSWVDQTNILEVLKNPAHLDPNVKKYIDENNSFTSRYFSDVKHLQKNLFKEIKGKIKLKDTTLKYKDKKYYYWSKTERDDNYGKRVRQLIDGSKSEEIYFDGDIEKKKSGSEYFGLGSIAVSHCDNYMAYSLDLKGSEYYTIYIRDISSNKLITEKIDETSGGITFSLDDKYIFYSKLDKFHRPRTIYRHKLGTPVKDDELIFEEKSEAFTVGIGLSADDKYFFISTSDHNTSEQYYFGVNEKNPKPKLIKERKRGIIYSVNSWDNYFYNHTNENAEDFKIDRCKDLSNQNWEEYIPAKNEVLVGGLSFLNDWMIRSETSNALSKLFVKDLKKNKEEELIFTDEKVIVPGISPTQKDKNTDLVYLSYSSPKTPGRTYLYNLKTKDKKLVKEQEIPSGHNPDDYIVERLECPSHDGRMVPITITRHKKTKIDGSSNLLLYGYGSYGSSMSPTFSSTRLSLIDRDIIWVTAHIRGGMERGMKWWKEGKLLNKKNTFEDYIAAAKYLIEKKYTSKGKIIGMGGSAGGLLMGAVVNQSPELFLGIIMAVPFVDSLTTNLDHSLPLTVGEFDEFGNAKENKDHFDYIYSYAPYNNIKKMDYPHILITTSLSDNRVLFDEPTKFTAKLRDYKTDNNLLLLKTEMNAGHGGKSGRDGAIEEIALDYAFALKIAEKI